MRSGTFTTRGTIVAMLVATAFVTGCGGGGHYPNQPRPPAPINMTVYIDDRRVSVSPTSVGAGPVQLIVTNQASNSESLTVLPAGTTAGQPLADTGPISPQGTAQVTVNLNSGDYTVATARHASTEAANATPGVGIQAALVHVGKQRPSASHQLLQP